MAGEKRRLPASLVQEARRADLPAWLRSRGYKLKHDGSGNYRVVGYAGLIVRENYWYWFSRDQKGNALDFLTKVLGYSFRDAVEELAGAGVAVSSSPRRQQEQEKQEKKELVLPEPSGSTTEIWAYLVGMRFLPPETVLELLKAGRVYEDTSGRVIWPCMANMKAVGGFWEHTVEKKKGVLKGSAPYCWVWDKGDGPAYVFESPVDAVSFWAMRRNPGKYVAMGGLRMNWLINTLRELQAREVVLAVDNDGAGHAFAQAAKARLEGEGYVVKRYTPVEKDWNDDLRKHCRLRL